MPNGPRSLKLIEVRGPLPEQVTCPDTKETFYTDERAGRSRNKPTFSVRGDLWSIARYRDLGQGYEEIRSSRRVRDSRVLPDVRSERRPYAGGSSTFPISEGIRCSISGVGTCQGHGLSGYWPRSEHPLRLHDAHPERPSINHGYPHWWNMFNPRQLLVHAHLLKTIVSDGESS